MKKKKSEDKSICEPSRFLILHLPPKKAVIEALANFQQKNKGFINYVFCRKWAVRIPAGTGETPLDTLYDLIF